MNFLITYPAIALTLPLLLAVAARWSMVPGDRKRTEWLLVAAVLATPLGAFAEGIAIALSRLRPLKYDLYVYRIDQLFGEPSFVLGSLVYHHRALMILVSITYGILPVVILGVFALYLYSGGEALQVLYTFVVNMLAAVPLYLLFPVCGPAFAFTNFPKRPGTLIAHPLAISAAPNGVPSVHTSSALLILWFVWPWKWARGPACAFLLLTMFATMGSGQHYFFDLLCAVPYAMAVYWVTRHAAEPISANHEGIGTATAHISARLKQLQRKAAQ
jgi:hypothetical protein